MVSSLVFTGELCSAKPSRFGRVGMKGVVVVLLCLSGYWYWRKPRQCPCPPQGETPGIPQAWAPTPRTIWASLQRPPQGPHLPNQEILAWPLCFPVFILGSLCWSAAPLACPTFVPCHLLFHPLPRPHSVCPCLSVEGQPRPPGPATLGGCF